jgi:hypothetical protein
MSDSIILNKRRSSFPPLVKQGAVALYADADSTLKTIDAQGTIKSVGSGQDVSGQVYTVATAPDPAQNIGRVILVSDGPLFFGDEGGTGPCAAISDGQSWLSIPVYFPIDAEF